MKLKLGAVIAIVIPAAEADAFFSTMLFSAFQEKLNLSYLQSQRKFCQSILHANLYNRAYLNLQKSWGISIVLVI